MIFISCLYDEPDPSTYRGMEIRIDRESEPLVFNSGNPTVDYVTAGCVVYTRAGGEVPIMGSSSIDHFVMDEGDLKTEEIPDDEIRAGYAAARAYLENHT